MPVLSTVIGMPVSLSKVGVWKSANSSLTWCQRYSVPLWKVLLKRFLKMTSNLQMRAKSFSNTLPSSPTQCEPKCMQSVHKACQMHHTGKSHTEGTYKRAVVILIKNRKITVIYVIHLPYLCTQWGDSPREFPTQLMSWLPGGFVYIASFWSKNQHSLTHHGNVFHISF